MTDCGKCGNPMDPANPQPCEEDGLCVPQDPTLAALWAENDARLNQLTEWGVRFPSGAVQNFEQDEHEARRFALNLNGLRPDLPTLVVRQVVTPWELADHPST